MRVSGIESYLGGADNVNALSVLHGEQLNFSGTVQDENSMAMDITDFTITAVAEFYRATVRSLVLGHVLLQPCLPWSQPYRTQTTPWLSLTTHSTLTTSRSLMPLLVASV